MTPDRIFCFICGAPTIQNTPRESSDSWLASVRFVGPDSDIRLHHDSENPDSSPYLSLPGRLWRENERDMVLPQVFDKESKRYIVQGFDVKRPYQPQEPSVGVGYPLHESCWNIFKEMLFVPNDTSKRQKMAKLCEILQNQAYDSGSVRWAHDYGGLVQYHSNSSFWQIPLEFSYIEHDPWNIQTCIQANPPADTPSRFSRFIPTLFKLPRELVERIYSYLDLSNLKGLEKIDIEDMTELPNSFWKKFLIPATAELGYFCLNQAHETLPDNSWFEISNLASNPELFSSGMRNRHRIWKLSKALANQIIDISESWIAGIDLIQKPSEDRLSSQAEFEKYPSSIVGASEESFRTPLVYPGTKALYEGSLSSKNTEEIRVFFGGSGALTFVSGLMLLPGGEKLGYITSSSRSIPIGSAAKIVAIASTKLGIVDLSFSSSLHITSWKDDSDFRKRKVAVKRRFLKNCDGLGRCITVQGEFDAAKLTTLRILSDDIVPANAITPRMIDVMNIAHSASDEEFIQQNAWIPSPPSSIYSINRLQNAGEIDAEEAASRRFPPAPIEQFVFPDSPTTYISCHLTGARRQLVGLTISFDDARQNPPVTIGDKQGAMKDFPINQKNGEEISKIILVFADADGVIIETNRGRRGLLGGFKLEAGGFETGQHFAYELAIAEGAKINGFYATSMLSEGGHQYSDLSSLRVISSSNLDQRKLLASDIERYREIEFETATNIQNKGYLNHHVSFHGPGGEQYANKANLTKCTRITAYTTSFPEARVIGLRLDSGTNGDNFGNPRILGQICREGAQSTVIDLNPNDRISEILVYTQEPTPRIVPSRPNWTWICGLMLKTVHGNEFLVGTQKEHPAKTIILESDSILQWDFNERYDGLRIRTTQDDEIDRAEVPAYPY